MDLFVLPSLNEGMGRALIEAMAAGLPVVATNVGGIPAVVQDGQTGILIPPGNPEALAAALERYLQSPESAKRIGAAARDHITEKFDVSALVRGVESVYEEALVGHASGRYDQPIDYLTTSGFPTVSFPSHFLKRSVHFPNRLSLYFSHLRDDSGLF